MIPQWLIERKRDGEAWTTAEIKEWVAGITDGTIPDYQLSAWSMAVFFRGMNSRETADLTDAMMRSGTLVRFGTLPGPSADKHSTGGIGDKISLVLAPLAASVGMYVPMISGRGLGLTGGTLDKLETIPGFKTNLSIEEFKRLTEEVGCCIIGQTDDLVPADRRLYALRDVTGTVPSIPLITASIMSKKLAEGAQTLVFDVKCGSGAFMKTLSDARQLAQSLLATGRALGRSCGVMITDMNDPLGRAVGNVLEVKECIDVLKGTGPDDVRELSLRLAARMGVLSDKFETEAEAYLALESNLKDGVAWEYFKRMIQAQGGDLRAIENPDLLPKAKVIHDVLSERSGYVQSVDAEAIGRIALALGAGRVVVTDEVDPGAGIMNLVQRGDHVEAGQPLMTLCTETESKATSVLLNARNAVIISSTPASERNLVLETL